MITRDSNYIGGQWRLASGSERFEVTDSATEEIIGTVTAATSAAEHCGRHDPGQVVIDEVAGQWVTLLLTGAGPIGAVAGFCLFRVLDVTKPWPARRLEGLPAGLGIMADDLMVALYGNILMQIGVRLLSGTPG